MLLCNRGARSAVVAWYTSSLFTPSFSSVLNADVRGQSLFMLTRTSAALAMWRVDRGSPGAEYPERLEDLVPRYLSAVSIDPFSDKPLIYERRGDGYLLASVGDNGVYDGGDDWSGRIIDGNWQEEERDVPRNASDLVVRMPMPIRPVVNPSTR